METRVLNDPWGDLPIDSSNATVRGGTLDRPGSDPYSQRQASVQQDYWAIALAAFEGPDAEDQVRQFLHSIRDLPAFRQTWTEKRGDRLIVYEGRFFDPLADPAQRRLARVREAELDGRFPFRGTKFVSLANFETAEESGSNDPLNLKAFVGMYSLQIGFYDQQFGEKFREAAEKAAQALREEGEQAFYYHGPHRSMITLGLFTEEDLSSQNGITVYSPKITELQDRYPFNLANGKTLIEKRGSGHMREQPSFLVKIH